MSNRSITISLMGVVTIFLLGCIVWRVKHPGFGQEYSSSDPFKYWKSLKYVSIERMLATSETVLLKDDAEYKKALNAKQIDDLQSLAGHFLKAYSTANYDNFLKFRFPTMDFHFQGNYIPNVRKMMIAKGVSTNLPMTDLEVFKWWWHFAIQTNQFSCAKCWQEVALNSPRLIRVESAKDGLTRLSQDMSANLSFEPTIFPSSIGEFDDTPQSIIEREGKLLVAVMTLTVKESSGAFRPVYVESYWSEKAQRWLPRFLGIGQYGGDSPTFCF